MSEDRDWYPQPLDERAAFHIKLDEQAADFAEKYDWDAATLASIHADRLWIEHAWQRRVEFDAKSKQLTEYINTISGNKEDVDTPEPFVFSSKGGAPPPEVPPGIEFRTRALRRETVNRSNYAEADGELLGFERAASAARDSSEIAPEITLETLANYQLKAKFSKQNMDAVRFEYRYNGGNWTALTDAPASPATLSVPPQTPNEAAQIEIRAIFLRKYQPIGKYSPSYSAVIAP